MWIERGQNGEIVGGSSNPQMKDCVPADGDWQKGELLNPEMLRYPQEWIPDAEYADWKRRRAEEAAARPKPPTQEERIKALEDKLAALSTDKVI